jgi:hypothetical protein
VRETCSLLGGSPVGLLDGNRLERARRDPGFVDERVADDVDPDAVALQDQDQVRERFAAVADSGSVSVMFVVCATKP